MGDPSLTLPEFYANLKRVFSSGFWISLRSTSDIAIETERRVLVSVFHPTIHRFLVQVSQPSGNQEMANHQYASIISQVSSVVQTSSNGLYEHTL